MTTTQSPILPGTHLWQVLFKAYHTLRLCNEASIEKSGLCLSDFGTLEFLYHKAEPQPVNTIGEAVQLTSGSITTAVDRLERRRFVRRLFHPEDRRIRLVTLTEEGRVFIRTAFQKHQQAVAKATGGVTDEEKEVLVRLLKKLGLFAKGTLPELVEENGH